VFSVTPDKDLLSCRYPPPTHADESDEPSNADSVIHIRSGNGSSGWEEKDHADEADPEDCDQIHRLTPPAQGVWPFYKLHTMLVYAVCDYDCDVA